MATGTDPTKWLKDHLPNCSKLTKDSTSSDYINCFKDIENISCKDIKDIISQVKDSSDEAKFLGFAKWFNDKNNKNVLEEGVNALTHTINNTKCMLNEINTQILTDKDDEKFDLNEIDDLRNIVVKNMGGITQAQYHKTLIGATVIISILVMILFFVLIFGRK
jgi:hypothetical protein